MNKGVLGLLWLISAGLAAFLGYRAGLADANPTGDLSDTSHSSLPKADVTDPAYEGRSGVSPSESAKNLSRQSMLSSSPVEQSEPMSLTDNQDENTELYSEQGKQLQRLGEALNDAADQAVAHNEMRQAFRRQYDENELDLQSQTNLTDFLQLHEASDLIDLHQIACTYQECQLLGQYRGEHQQWSDIIEQMKEQDWWDYQGTSSSSSTHDGMTYFNLYIDKGTSGQD